MKNLHGSYVLRGDELRRGRRIRQALLLAGFLLACTAFYGTREPEVATAAPASGAPFYLRGEAKKLFDELAHTRGELYLVTAQLERATAVLKFSAEYGIAADLAESIFDIAVAEGIDPALAFRVVRVESGFNERATSPVGAIGLAQVMLGTARYFSPEITREELYARDTNLRIGFRYLRALLDEHRGDMRTALLVYNRGPTAVRSSLAAGLDPANGYERLVLSGYTGAGRMD
ncbi:MAG TPA: transglycosylase SLT domain-containing protein [Gemmatimonadaceae bacterium]|nr:transglycosylase SLT domain-containing protein [Gemmatimonadaceae bacterium]